MATEIDQKAHAAAHLVFDKATVAAYREMFADLTTKGEPGDHVHLSDYFSPESHRDLFEGVGECAPDASEIETTILQTGPDAFVITSAGHSSPVLTRDQVEADLDNFEMQNAMDELMAGLFEAGED